MTTTFLVFALFASALAPPYDCGLQANRALIDKTRALVEYRAPLNVETPEMASGPGRQECVRLEFQLDRYGKVTNIVLKESTNELLMNVAAAHALRKYTFKSAAGGTHAVYSLMFEGVVGAAPPYP
ncbi:energy transducer TonB [Dyella mobilis]|uniref:Energy transducer TonB n=1 Tax=Dyella mobilis TaxID=1849582 RepID=A0ABS2KDJ2_9GAMM|nr:energy transducer TonB [Dyella mobilis]MBM7128953.1 energy transducer TonB [Dyella mobilis]GLQ99357.1 hypothetical protein GCM10007863_37770 [Dyella mobilis]